MPDRGKQILRALKTRHRERVFVGRHPNEINDRIHGETPDELAAIVGDGHRDEIVALERLRGSGGGIGWTECERIRLHDRRDGCVGLREHECLQTDGAPQQIAGVDHEQTIEVAGKVRARWRSARTSATVCDSRTATTSRLISRPTEFGG